MNSTDHNLNNPLLVGTLRINNEVSSWKSPTVEHISQEMYDRLQVKDPLKIYVIADSKDGRIYLGDARIPNDRVSSKYFVGIDKTTREYVLYMNIHNGALDKLIPISRYDNPLTAFDALSLCSNAGSHQDINLALFTAIAAYIDKLTNVNDLVLGAMSLFGYKNDPRLQHLVEFVLSYGGAHSKDKLPHILLDVLETDIKFAPNSVNPLFKIYLDVYKVIEKYNFFGANEYHQGVDKLDLDKPIADIISAIGVYTSPFGEY